MNLLFCGSAICGPLIVMSNNRICRLHICWLLSLVMMSGSVLAQTPAETYRKILPAIELLLGSDDSAIVYNVFTDHLNTPRVITNQVGQAVWRYDNNDPFGGNVPDENPSSLGAFEFPLRDEGTYFDKETGLAYNWHRYRDLGSGRFIQADPLGLDGGDLSLYVLRRNNPLSFTDPTGEFVWLPFVIGGALLVGSQSSTFQQMAGNAAQYWANQAAQTDNPFAAFGFNFLGATAALGDQCTAGTTAMVLGVGAGLGAYLGRPFWQYYPAGNPAYSSPFLTRGWGWTSPYPPGPHAAAQLGLPPWNPGTAVRAINPGMRTFVQGPTVVPRYTSPSYSGYVQPGGGIQFSTRAWPAGPLAPGPF